MTDAAPEFGNGGRTPPVPRSVSPEAQAFLAAAGAAVRARSYPAPGDRAGWDRVAAEMEAGMAAMDLGRAAADKVAVEPLQMRGVPGFLVHPLGDADCGGRVLIDIHGGALIAGSGATCAAMASGVALSLRARVYAVDYRMPPAYPYPAALDDCLAAYRHVLDLHGADRVIVRGGSAGGNLAAALCLRARDEGLRLPRALILPTSELDLTESGDSFLANHGVDVVLPYSLMPINRLYAGAHPLEHPYLSPLFGDFAPGFPPTLQITGTRDLFLSNVVRMHNRLRQAGIASELLIGEAMPHGGFGGNTPEDRAFEAEVRAFAGRHWA